MAKISVVISAYNEEKNIGECLASVEKLGDELIVVDNSSTDDTAKIAKKLGAKIYEQENNPSRIDIQKNLGFEKATGDWILSLDADERVTSELASEIKSVVSGNLSVVGFWIPRKNIIFGKWIHSQMWWPDYQLRLFKKGKGKFSENSVHKDLKVEGATEKLETPMIHNNYTSVSQYIFKLNNYTDMEAENLLKKEYKLNYVDAIRFPIDDFVKTFFLQKGYVDGLHGLVLSILQSFYMEVVFAKVWERKGFEQKEGEDFLNLVTSEIKNSKDKIKYWIASEAIHNSSNPIKKALLRFSRKMASGNRNS